MNLLELRDGQSIPPSSFAELLKSVACRVLESAPAKQALRLGFELTGADGREFWTLDFREGTLSSKAVLPVHVLVRGDARALASVIENGGDMMELFRSGLARVQGDPEALRRISAVFG